MLRRIRRIILFLLLAVVAALLFGVIQTQRTPSYYQPPRFSAQQREDIAQSALNKYLRVADAISEAAAAETRARNAARHGQPIPPAAPAVPQVLSLSQDEINASFHHFWADEHQDQFDRWVQSPMVALFNGQIILAGKLVSPSLVVSAYLSPRVDEQGALHLEVTSLRGGLLPIPQATLASQRARVQNGLLARMPAWRQQAKMDHSGGMNSEAVEALMAALVLHSLENQPSSSILAMPMPQGHAMPVRLTKVAIENQTLTMTLEYVPAAERERLMEQIRLR